VERKKQTGHTKPIKLNRKPSIWPIVKPNLEFKCIKAYNTIMGSQKEELRNDRVTIAAFCAGSHAAEQAGFPIADPYANQCARVLYAGLNIEESKAWDQESISAAIGCLNFCLVRVPDVAHYIHDLWSGSALLSGRESAKKADPNHPHAHPLIKTLKEFTHPELIKEHMLAHGDLEGIASGLQDLALRHSVANPEAIPNFQSVEDLQKYFKTHDVWQVFSVLFTMIKDQELLDRMCQHIHKNWQKVNADISGFMPTDTRIDRPYAELSPKDKRVTATNVRSDILAVVLYLCDTLRLEVPRPLGGNVLLI